MSSLIPGGGKRLPALEQRLALLHRLIGDHPDAYATCIDTSLEVAPRPTLIDDLGFGVRDVEGTILAEVIPDDQAKAALIWDRANNEGIGQGLVRYTRHPDDEVGLHIVNLVPEHGVFVCVEGGGHDSVPAESSGAHERLAPRRMVHRLNEMGTIIAVDHPTTQALGWTEHDLVGSSALDYIHPDDVDRSFTAWVAMLADTDAGQPLRFRYRRLDGSYRWYEAHYTSNLQAEDETERWVESEHIDVHDEMEAMAQLRAGEVQFRTLTESLPVGVIQVTAEGAIVYTNRWLRDLAGDATPDTEAAAYDWSLVHPDDIERVHQAFSIAVHTGGGTDVDARLIHQRTGRTHRCRVRVRALVEDGEVSGAIASVEDVTESMSLQQQLREQAASDPLTGLANRRELIAWLNGTLDDAHQKGGPTTAVLFVDLDGFKLINDGLGHDAGDELLIEVARRLRDTMRPSDMLARFGGDEFVVACPGVTTAEEAVTIAERVLGAIDGPIVVADTATSVGCSIGIAVEDAAHPADADLLISNADLAMYQAKRNGGSRWTVYGEPLRTRIRQRFQIQRDLRAGLDGGQFELHVQPIFDLQTRRLVAGEALVRWNHPERGLISPDRFVPVAEESGQMVALGAWIVDDACRLAARCRAAGFEPFRLAVNLSGRQLAAEGFDQMLAATMERHGVAPRQLILEVTETVFVDTRQDVMFLLAQLTEAGLTVALDDFGTGYSSLNHLRVMPATMVKVDSTYIAELDEHDGTTAIIEAMVDLTGRLGLEMVAEGIERDDQLERLTAMGVRFGQGYHLGRPMHEDEFFAQLAATSSTRRD